MIHATLCKRCAKMLHGSVLTVCRIGGIEDKETTCPWCQRNTPDATYIIRERKEV